MHPIAFQIGSLTIRWYGIMMALSMMLGATLAAKLLKRQGRNGELVWDGLVWIILAGVAGARLVYVLTNWSAYSANPSEIIAIWHGGLSFHGGVIAGGLATYYYFRGKGIPFIEVADAFSPGVCLGIVLVRIGNFMNGDILGYKWTGPWAMNFPFDELHGGPNAGKIIPRHPAEIYGMAVGAICLLITMLLWNSTYIRRRLAPGATFMGFMLAYSLVRSFIEEPFRDVPLFPVGHPLIDPAKYGYGLLTATQIVSVVIILVAIWGFTQLRRWEAIRAAAPPMPVRPLEPGMTRQQRRKRERELEKRRKDD